MKKSMLLIVSLVSGLAIAQGVRYDIPPILGPTGQPLPNIAVTLCSGTGTINNTTCSPQTQSFSDITLGLSCPLGSPVTLTGLIGCQSTSDAFGNAGLWLSPGAYIYCLSGRGIAGACYNLTVPAGSTPSGILRTGNIITPGPIGFSPSSTGASDTGLSRTAAGNVAVGNGTQGDSSGTLKASVSQLANGTSSAPSYAFTNDTGSGMYRQNTNVLGWTVGGVDALLLGSSQFRIGNAFVIGWAAAADPAGSITDTSFSRTAAATVAIGNGTQGDASGTLKAATVNATSGFQVNGTALACGNLSNGAPSCSTDTTNASNITSGTIATARLNPSVSGHTYLGNNTGSSTAAGFVQPAASDLSNGTTGSGAVVLASSPTIASPTLTSPTLTSPTLTGPTISGTLASYNGVATTGVGMPTVVASVTLTNQSAAISSTTLYNVPANGSGLYMVCWDVVITTAGTGGNIVFGPLQYNNGAANVSTGTANVSVGAVGNEGNAVGGVSCGMLSAALNSQITYQTSFSGVTGSPVYSLKIRLLAL